MANKKIGDQYLNKVVLGNEVLMDISQSSENDVTAADILRGKKTFDKNGANIEGTCDYNADVRNDTVEAQYVLATKTFHAGSGTPSQSTGSMPNRGAVDINLDNTALPESKLAGYYSAVTFSVPSAEQATVLKPDNIRKDVHILGVTGTYEGTDKIQEYKWGQASAWDGNESTAKFTTVSPDATYNALGTVKVGKIWYNTSSTEGTTGLTANIVSLAEPTV